MATIKDVRRETGLSLATISKYINGGNVREKNRAVIEEAIERLGFTVNDFARGLKTNRSRSIGVVIPDLSNAFITTIISWAEELLQKSGYSVQVCDCRGDAGREREAVGFLLSKRVDGIINMPVDPDGRHLDIAVDRNVPVVLIDRLIPRLRGQTDAVLIDNASAASQAVSVLLEAGHRSIGVILGPEGLYTSEQRRLGCARALDRYGLSPDAGRTIYSDYTVQGGYESMCALLKEKKITAVFVSNHEMTLGAMIAVNDLGVRIPSALSFIGFDNEPLSKVMQPRLSIITQPLEQIGRTAAEILLERLAPDAQPREGRTVVLPAALLRGGSVQSVSAEARNIPEHGREALV